MPATPLRVRSRAQTLRDPRRGEHTHGKHTLYFGGEANRRMIAQQTTLNDYGAFTFTPQTNTASRPRLRSRDFMFGSPEHNGTRTSLCMRTQITSTLGCSFRTTGGCSNLTLNLGIRYDVQTAPTDTQHMTDAVVLPARSRQSRRHFPRASSAGRSGVPAAAEHALQSRFTARRLCLDPIANGHTVIHGAAGLFYGSVGGNLCTIPRMASLSRAVPHSPL